MLNRILFAFSTHSIRHGGSRSAPVLILGDYNQDRFHRTFSSGKPISDGESRLFEADVADRNLPTYFPIIRVGLRGSDAWWPRAVLVLGEQVEGPHTHYIPLGVRTSTPQQLNADSDAGRDSMPLYRASLGTPGIALRRFLLLIQNADVQDAGPENKIQVTIEFRRGPSHSFSVEPDTFEGAGAAHIAIGHLPAPFTVASIRRVSVRIEGAATWMPQRFFLYAIDEGATDYETLVPVVTIGNWAETGLGAFDGEGRAGVEEMDLYRAYF